MPRNRVHKRSDGRYTYKATDTTGKRHTVVQRARESRDAFLDRCDELDRLVTGEWRTETLNDLFGLFQKQYLELNNSKSDAEITSYLYRDHVKPFLGHKKLSDIKRADVHHVLTAAVKKGLSPSTVKKVRGCISRPYNWAINSLGMSITSPTTGLVFKYNTPQSRSTPIRVISDDELERFFSAARGTKYTNYYRLLYATGMRPSEALGLQITDITDEYIQIRRGVTTRGLSNLKTGNAVRDFPVTPEIRSILDDQIQYIGRDTTRDQWLFPSASGQPAMNALRLSFNRITRRAGTTFTLYNFRHTFATHMAEAGVSAQALMLLMGHADISTTLKYYVGLTEPMMDAARRVISNRVQNRGRITEPDTACVQMKTPVTLQPQGLCNGTPSGIRTPDPLIKSQLLCQLS